LKKTFLILFSLLLLAVSVNATTTILSLPWNINLSNEEKTNLFAVGKFMKNNVVNEVSKMKINLTFTIKEYKFLSNTFRSKIPFNGDEIFNMIDLNEKYLKKWVEIYKKLPKHETEFDVIIDINNLVMLYHFLNKYSIKGINEEFYNFATLLEKIAETHKVYNAFGVLIERINTDYEQWISNMGTDEKEDEQQNEQQKEQQNEQ